MKFSAVFIIKNGDSLTLYLVSPSDFTVNFAIAHYSSKPIPALTNENVTITDDSVKAELFNKYFYSVFAKEDMTSFSSLQQSTTMSPSLIDSIEFSPAVVYAVVYEYLSNINSSKSCGPRLSLETLCNCYCISISLFVQSFHAYWLFTQGLGDSKHSSRDKKNVVNNYRMISSLNENRSVATLLHGLSGISCTFSGSRV